MRTARYLGLVITIVLAWPLAAQEKPKEKPSKPEPKEKMVKAGRVAGTIARLPEMETFALSIKGVPLPIDVRMAENVKVRFLNPPPQFDDKGKIKKLTKKELDELKGPDKTLPGYTADLSDLKMGQIVEVHLVKKQGRPKNPKDKDEVAEYAPRAGIIVIIAEPQN